MLKSRLIPLAFLSVCLTGVISMKVGAQKAPQFNDPHYIVPASSVVNPADRGIRAHTNYLYPRGARPSIGLGPNGGMSPGQLKALYGLPSTGGSCAIAIVDAYHYPFALNDFNVYSKQFGLPHETGKSPYLASNKVFQVVFATGAQPRTDVSWSGEMALDIEMAHGLAPCAKIYLVEAASNSLLDLFNAVLVAAQLPHVKEVAMSWGVSEFSEETFLDGVFTQPGVTYVAATGDFGTLFDSLFGQNYPACSPNVIAAGGTTLLTDANGNFVDEQGWNSGGGGVSFYEPVPSFQYNSSILSAIDTTIAEVNTVFALYSVPLLPTTEMRAVPDLAFDADPNTGPAIYSSIIGGWIPMGGTSASAQALAAILNLAGTEQGCFPACSQAALTDIYLNWATIGGFRDIVNDYDFDPILNPIACMPGWDGVTGVGSPWGLSGLQKP